MEYSKKENDALLDIQGALLEIRDKCNSNSDISTEDRDRLRAVANTAHSLLKSLLNRQAETLSGTFDEFDKELAKNRKRLRNPR